MTLALFGVRHHGTGCARALVSALEAFRPDVILVEGPPEGTSALQRVLEARPPVALIAYPKDDPKRAQIYPFAEFSPEWVAIRYAKTRGVSVEFMDLPIKNLFGFEDSVAKAFEKSLNEDAPSSDSEDDAPNASASEENGAAETENAEKTENENELNLAEEIRLDPLKTLARIAGEPSPERWEYRLFAQATTPGDFFPVLLEATTELRLALRDDATRQDAAVEAPSSEASEAVEECEEPNAETDSVDFHELARLAAAIAKTSGGGADLLEPFREAAMRRELRLALQCYDRVAVVCGAWHAPALDLETDDPRRRSLIPSEEDDEALLSGLSEMETTATWIPWTHSRLDRRSGYGAGIDAPEWLLEIWRASGEARRLDETIASSKTERGRVVAEAFDGCETFRNASARFLSRAARYLRDDQMLASTANVVEALRLADALAAIRERTAPSLDELREATISVLCGGSETLYETIRDRLEVGDELGSVPSDAPSPPLAQDVELERLRLELEQSAFEQQIDLDVRETRDREISRFFRRLNFIHVPWAEPRAEDARSRGTFRESWSFQWRPTFAVAIIDASRYGSTLEEAASNLAIVRLEKAATLAEIVELVELVFLAELDENATAKIYQKLQAGVNLSDDVGDAVAAIPPLSRILRYGTARGCADPRLVPIFASLFERATARLREICVNIDFEVAESVALKLAELYPAALTLDDDPQFQNDFGDLSQRLLDAFERVVEDSTASRYLVGFLARELYEHKRWNRDELALKLSFFFSLGVELDDVAAWLQGFLAETAGSILWFDELWRVLDERIMGFDRDSFYDYLPLLRRAFASFSNAELRALGRTIANLHLPAEADDETKEERRDVWENSETQPLLQSLDIIFNGGGDGS